jgi:hypothetical protein
VPDEVVCELLPDKSGYVAHGDRQEVAEKDLRAIIFGLLPNEPPGKTTGQILKDWPTDQPPWKKRLLDELKRGTDVRDWLRDGDGNKGSPFTYWVRAGP